MRNLIPRGAWLVLLAVVAAVVGIVALAGSLAKGQTNHVPVDAQSQLMQPRKPNRLDIIERRLDKIEEKLGRIVFTEDIEPALKANWIDINAEANQ